MHETIIAKKIIDEAKKSGAKKAIEVEVGILSEITSEELLDALKNMAKWDVKEISRKRRVKCSCGYIGEARIIDRGHGYCLFNCPKCSGKPSVLEGGEIKITGVS